MHSLISWCENCIALNTTVYSRNWKCTSNFINLKSISAFKIFPHTLLAALSRTASLIYCTGYFQAKHLLLESTLFLLVVGLLTLN